MIEITDKKDAVETMKRLGLNYFPLDVFDIDDIEGIKKFFKKYPSPEYVLRNTDKAGGKFFFVSSFEETLPLLQNFEQNVTIDVSYNPYKEDIVLVGDVKVTKDGFQDMIDLIARDDEEGTNRNVYENPKYNLHTTLDDEKLWEIPGFTKLMDYISTHELYNMIVEFIIYDCKLGVKKENVVIVEIRTDY